MLDAMTISVATTAATFHFLLATEDSLAELNRDRLQPHRRQVARLAAASALAAAMGGKLPLVGALRAWKNRELVALSTNPDG